MAWLAVAFWSPSWCLSCSGSQQRFGRADLPLHDRLVKQLNTFIFCLWNIFRLQLGFFLVRLQYARPERLSHEPVSTRPRTGRYLVSYKFNALFKLPKIIGCTSASFVLSLERHLLPWPLILTQKVCAYIFIIFRSNCNRYRSMLIAKEVDRGNSRCGEVTESLRLSTNRHVATACQNLNKQSNILFIPIYSTCDLSIGFLRSFRCHDNKKCSEKKTASVCTMDLNQ
jgi:hypothetical protein